MGKIKGRKLPIIHISVQRVSCEVLWAYIWAGRKSAYGELYHLHSTEQVGEVVQQYMNECLCNECNEVEEDNGVTYLTDKEVKTLVKGKGKQNDNNDR